MKWKTIDELKDSLRKAGHETKALLSDAEMEHALTVLAAQPGVLETPAAELRYMEGLLSLRMGFLDGFKIIPDPKYAKCQCGRVPSALDVVHYAYAKQLHARDLIRDTLIGFANIFEMAEGGRVTECFNCARRLVVASYFRKHYMYA